MTFWEHLAELRSRLMKIVAATFVGAVAAWFIREDILQWLLGPFQDAWIQHFKEAPKVHFKGPADLFMIYIKVAIIAGVILALPIIFYQLWAFIAPGLYKREKRFALPFVFSSTGMFIGGAYYGMKLAFPLAFAYLLAFATPTRDKPPEQPDVTAVAGAAAVSTVNDANGGQASVPEAQPPGNPSPAGSSVVINPAGAADQSVLNKQGGVLIEATIMVDDYIKFIAQMLLAFGLVFELPVVVFFLSVAGVVNYRQLIKFFRYFVVLAFFIAAVFTPPDIGSQFLLAIPMTVLYTISIGIAYVFGRKPPS
jgi:sec-independent protein translocase protein TatC